MERNLMSDSKFGPLKFKVQEPMNFAEHRGRGKKCLVFLV